MRKIFIAALILLAGCATSPIQRTAVYNPAEYAPYAHPGNGRIIGQAFMETVGGDVKYAAGNPVILHPVTSYTTEWFEKTIVQGLKLTQGDPRGNQYVMQTTANAEGRFAFEHLPAGQYYLTCPIIWGVPGPSGIESTGGIAYAKVTVPPNGTVAAIVTR
jgi:hypothetical protein